MKPTSNQTPLIEPYGNKLVNLLVSPEEKKDLKKYAAGLQSLQLSARSICDLEMLALGGFSPLERFMGRADYLRVVGESRLENNLVFPIPVTLPVKQLSGIRENQEIALRDPRNNLLAVMKVEEIYEWDKAEFARQVLGTLDEKHPLAAEMSSWSGQNLTGRLRVIEIPGHFDFPELRLGPAEVRDRLARFGYSKVVAFQTRNPLHRAHEELIRRALEQTGGALLLHPVVGLTKPGDVDYFCRVQTYQILAEKYFDKTRSLLSLLPLAMRFAGPREALWHAVIRRNYGANHIIIGRDHAGAGLDSGGKPFYEPFSAQELVEQFSPEIGVRVLRFDEFVYVPESGLYEEASKVPAGQKFLSLSGTEARERYLNKNRPLPAWFTRPEIARVLEEASQPRHRQGVCVWFTGLSGAGKSTIAEILTARLPDLGRRVTLLDGDIVRTHLSAGLGFDKAGRETNIRRIGFVASEIVRHGGLVICAAISPYRAIRAEVREMIGHRNFIEVFVDTPLEVCESRDTKGLYAKARRGEIKDFTGIDDVYEPPAGPEIKIQTVNQTAEECANFILDYLIGREFVRVKDYSERADYFPGAASQP